MDVVNVILKVSIYDIVLGIGEIEKEDNIFDI